MIVMKYKYLLKVRWGENLRNMELFPPQPVVVKKRILPDENFGRPEAIAPLAEWR